MILHSLQEYYHRLAGKPDAGVATPGYSREKIFFVFILSPGGELLDVIPLYDVKGMKKIPASMKVPERVKKTSGIAPNFLCENASYVLGLDYKGKPERARAAFDRFVDLHKTILAGLNDEGAKALLLFLQSRSAGEIREKVLQDILEPLGEGGNIVFRLEGDSCYIHEREAVKNAWADYKSALRENAYNAQCLLTGKVAPIALLHPSIKGVTGGQLGGASIVSFNDEAYISYGKKQSYNAPVSEDATFAYTTAINYLLNSRKNRLQIADTTTVFWADREEEENLIAAFFDPPEAENGKDGIDLVSTQKIRDILLQIRDGKKPAEAGIDEKTRFSILGLAPNAARISIRFYHEGDFGTLMEHVGRHYGDMAIAAHPDYRHTMPAIWRILLETATQKKRENIPGNLTTGLMQAVLKGNAYPRNVYSAMMTRIRADRKINPIRAGYIKAYLTRKMRSKKENETEGMIAMTLNPDFQNQGYILGRLFALLERAQERASGGTLNTTIRDRYFGAASATPAAIFPILLRLSQHHLSKAEYGYAIDRQIQEVINLLDGQAGFPKHLNLDDQGYFMLGYYQQRQAFYTRKEEKKEEEE